MFTPIRCLPYSSPRSSACDEGIGRVAHVDEADAPAGHRRDVPLEELHHRPGGGQPFVAGAEQQARVEHHQRELVLLAVLERQLLLVDLREVVRPAADDLERGSRPPRCRCARCLRDRDGAGGGGEHHALEASPAPAPPRAARGCRPRGARTSPARPRDRRRPCRRGGRRTSTPASARFTAAALGQVRLHELAVAEQLGARGAAAEHPEPVPGGRQLRDQALSEEARRPGDQDGPAGAHPGPPPELLRGRAGAGASSTSGSSQNTPALAQPLHRLLGDAGHQPVALAAGHALARAAQLRDTERGADPDLEISVCFGNTRPLGSASYVPSR